MKSFIKFSSPPAPNFFQIGSINWTLIIFIIIFIFAFMLAGGTFFFKGQAPRPDNSNEMVPTSTFDGTPKITHLWSLKVKSRLPYPSCDVVNGQKVGRFKVDAMGPTVGYITLEIALTTGGYETKVTRAFVEPSGSTYELYLPINVQNPNKFGYDRSSWRIRLFEGGKKNGFIYTGGILRATVVNNPTSCVL